MKHSLIFGLWVIIVTQKRAPRQLKVNNTSTRRNSKICSKLPIKTLKGRSTISNVDVEHISHLLLLFLMLTLSKQMFAGTHPINLKTLKLFWQSLTDVQISQWNNYSKLVIPKNHCFLYTVFNHREQSFPEHSVSLFHESRCGNPLLNVYRIYFGRPLAAMNYVHTMYLINTSI